MTAKTPGSGATEINLRAVSVIRSWLFGHHRLTLSSWQQTLGVAWLIVACPFLVFKDG
ncbi:MAG: hypothetical protein OXC63_12610 [Aestuariivita sp.]|nr:hypothetical protein [Aestuariivita sp.]